MYNPEIKTFDTAITADQVALAGEVFCLSLIAQGDDYNGRTGRSVNLKSFQLRLVIQPDTDQAVTCLMRIIVFIDTNPTTGAENPVIGDIISSAYALRNAEPGFITRYRVIYDDTKWVGGAGANNTGGDPNFQVFECYRKLTQKMSFISSGGTTATMGKNSIWMVIMPTGAADAQTPVINGTTRLRYTDS